MSGNAIEQFNIHEAKTQLSRIVEQVEDGAEVVISRAGTPVAKVIPFAAPAGRRGRGSLAGLIQLEDDWDSDEVNDEIATQFGLQP